MKVKLFKKLAFAGREENRGVARHKRQNLSGREEEEKDEGMLVLAEECWLRRVSFDKTEGNSTTKTSRPHTGHTGH